MRLAKCDFVEDILKSSKHIEKSPSYKLLETWLGEGVYNILLSLHLFSVKPNSILYVRKISGLISSTGN